MAQKMAQKNKASVIIINIMFSPAVAHPMKLCYDSLYHVGYISSKTYGFGKNRCLLFIITI